MRGDDAWCSGWGTGGWGGESGGSHRPSNRVSLTPPDPTQFIPSSLPSQFSCLPLPESAVCLSHVTKFVISDWFLPSCWCRKSKFLQSKDGLSRCQHCGLWVDATGIQPQTAPSEKVSFCTPFLLGFHPRRVPSSLPASPPPVAAGRCRTVRSHGSCRLMCAVNAEEMEKLNRKSTSSTKHLSVS